MLIFLYQSRENTVSFKRQRIERKIQASIQRDASEVREGTTYESAIGASDVQPSVEAVPPPTCPAVSSNAEFIFFDLETTGLSHTCDILQVSAVCGTKTFDKYVIPYKVFTPRPAG